MSTAGRFGLVIAVAVVVAVASFSNLVAPGSRTVGTERPRGSISLPRPVGADPATPRAWRMQLRLDTDIRQPGPEWMLREGLRAGAGYELAWDPSALSLRLSRGGGEPLLLGSVRLSRPPREVLFARRGARLDVRVDGEAVLAALDPQGAPEPGSGAFPDGWSLVAPGSLGISTTFSVRDDGDLPPAWGSDVPPGNEAMLAREVARGPSDPGERDRAGVPRRILALRPGEYVPPEDPGRPDYALLRVRMALTTRAKTDPGAAQQLLGEATRAVSALGTSHPEYQRLQLWLAWAEVRFALDTFGKHELDTANGHWSEDIDLDPRLMPADGDEFPIRFRIELARVRTAIDQLAVEATNRRQPEGAGLLIALLHDLTENALKRSAVPRPLAWVLEERAAWLGMLDRAARAAGEALGPGAGEAMRMQLRFISHAAGALAGPSDDPEAPRTLPTPADAPDWLTVRWRALAGTDPGQSALPPPTVSQVAPSPLLPVIADLVQSAVLDPLPAVRLRAALSDSGNEPFRVRLERSADKVPDREVWLARLLVALHALASSPPGPVRQEAVAEVKAAALLLGPVRKDSPASGSLVQRDPLAFALACLAAARLQQAVPQNTSDELNRVDFDPPPLSGGFSGLSPFGLLSGAQRGTHGSRSEDDATDLIWLHNDAVLPPAQALAAALAMQEVYRERNRAAGLTAEPDWSALRRLPSFTLPLDLLDPVARPRSGPPEPRPNRTSPVP